MTPATLEKRQALAAFIERKLKPYPEVQGVVAIGSLASGLARPDSDMDAILFLDPLDLYIVPAEAIWHPPTDTFHSIFTHDSAVQEQGLQFDFLRCDLRQWADPSFPWPEARRAELRDGWVAYDRTGQVAELITARTVYDDEARQARLDEAITWLDQHLSDDGPPQRWDSLGPAIAHDRLQAAYDYLVQALFALNRRWRPWRNREMSSLLALPWLPDGFGEGALTALNAPSHDHAGYMARAETLLRLFHALLARLQADGTYGDDPIGEAFIRGAEEPGRAWNMKEWNRRHGQRSSR